MRFVYEKVKRVGDQTEIVLYVDFNEEFLEEFESDEKETCDDVKKQAETYIQQRYPHIKHATVSIMAGMMLLLSFPYVASVHEANFHMSYLYFGNSATYISQIEKTQGVLDVVSPNYFNVNADGTLKLTAQFDPSFIRDMHARNIKVVPFLSNHWDRELGRAALENRETLAQQMADAVIAYNLDGVQVDIENVTDVDRDHYTEFVRLLREKIPADKEVSVAVAANPNGWTKGWHGSYDYRKLGEYSDYLMVMTYDESYPGGREGPVASRPWVERSIQYALNQGVPPEKIVLGIPFYGRYWKVGESYGGYGISNKRILELVERYNGTVQYDEQTQSALATVTIKEGDPSAVVAGRTLTPGTYRIWFENPESLKAKMELIHQYNLKGSGSWSLGQEQEGIWNYYRAWALGHRDVSPPPIPQQKQPQTGATYIVKPGDTLWKIARQFNLTVEQLKTYNGLKSDMIVVGQVLKVQQDAKPSVPAKSAIIAKQGTKSAEVKKLETDLKTLGYFKGTPDTTFDAATKNALAAYQKAAKLNPTGALDAVTRDQLASSVKAKAAQAQTLKVGSKGAAVVQLQKNLKALKLYNGKIDGRFGVGTKQAVMKFQKANKLKATGVYDSTTKAKMEAKLKRR